jgi:WXXGXW repeat (2 copies)
MSQIRYVNVTLRCTPPPSGGPPEMFVWQPGHWRWDGHDYAWHPGHYERRPAREAVWVPPEWVDRGGQWVFRPGHWVYH